PRRGHGHSLSLCHHYVLVAVLGMNDDGALDYVDDSGSGRADPNRQNRAPNADRGRACFQGDAVVAHFAGDEAKHTGTEIPDRGSARRRRIEDVLVENELAGAFELNGSAIEEADLERSVGLRFQCFVLVYLVGQTQLQLRAFDRLTIGDVLEFVHRPDRLRAGRSRPPEGYDDDREETEQTHHATSCNHPHNTIRRETTP